MRGEEETVLEWRGELLLTNKFKVAIAVDAALVGDEGTLEFDRVLERVKAKGPEKEFLGTE